MDEAAQGPADITRAVKPVIKHLAELGIDIDPGSEAEAALMRIGLFAWQAGYARGAGDLHDAIVAPEPPSPI